MNASASTASAASSHHQSQPHHQQQIDSNDLYINNSSQNFNQINNLVSPSLLHQPNYNRHFQTTNSVDNANIIFENSNFNENDNNNNNHFQNIIDLKQQQHQQFIQPINMLNSSLAATHQSSQFQITSISEQYQQPLPTAANQRFRIVKTDSEKTSSLNGTIVSNGSGFDDAIGSDEHGNVLSNCQNNASQLNAAVNRTNQLNGNTNSYQRGRWHVMDNLTVVMDQQNKQHQSINTNINQNHVLQTATPQLKPTIQQLNATKSSSPLLIAQPSTNACPLSEEQLSNAILYSNNQTEYTSSTINSENLNESASTLTITQSIATATLPQTHFNPITPHNNNGSNIDSSYYSPQSVYNSSVNLPSQLVQPLITPTNNATSTNITIKPVPIVNNIQQKQQIILTNNNNGSSASSSPTPPSQPQPPSKIPLVTNSSSSTNSPVALTLNIENRESIQSMNTTTSSVSSSVTNSLGTSGAIPSSNQPINNTTPAMISNLNEQVQTNMEKIQQTQSSIGQISSQISKPTTNQIFSNPNNSNQQQHLQKESNIIMETSNNTNLNEATYNQQNTINLNDQSTNQLTSNLASNGTNSSLSVNPTNKLTPLQYQSQLQQQIPSVNFENLNANVSINNSSSSNSDYNQSSPKEQQHLPQQQLTSTAVQMVNSSSLSNQNTLSINTGINTPPLSNLITNAATNTTVSNLTSSSSTAFIDQTTATLDLLMSGTETNWTDLNKKPLDADKGIKSRIELAMDLVKTHLTSAVNQEIVLLKSQIKQLTEKCARLEQENSILKKHALPETLSLIENRGSILIPNQSATNLINNNNNSNNSNSCLQSVNNNGLNAINSNILTNNDINNSIATSHPISSNELANNTLLSITVDNLKDCMTNSLTEHILNNNDPLPEALVHSSQKTFNEIDSLQNHNIHISDESILNINETNDSSNIN